MGTFMTTLLVILGIIAVLAVILIGIYNRLVALSVIGCIKIKHPWR